MGGSGADFGQQKNLNIDALRSKERQLIKVQVLPAAQ
jgi:hypothetical protein